MLRTDVSSDHVVIAVEPVRRRGLRRWWCGGGERVASAIGHTAGACQPGGLSAAAALCRSLAAGELGDLRRRRVRCAAG